AIKWPALVLALIAVAVAIRRLPVAATLDALESRIDALGVWGPAVFALAYIVAVVALVPASPLTLAAGAMFGPVVGTITASLSSTVGAAASFLVARYLARDSFAGAIRQYPKFDAVDKAIGEGGWRLVALLRLSPAVPFNMQNYLYGLTRIRFWAYLLTSWIAMLPGTFMYVYLGHVGRAGVEAATGGGRQRTPAEWAMIALGLLATIGVTIYVTRLARRVMAHDADAAAALKNEEQTR
ncbi:MAG: TVP38/TMEM64 family protein, partial [Bradyrhizobium sp.]